MLATGDTATAERRDEVATLTRAQELNAKWRHLREGHAADDGHAVHASADESGGGEARVLPAAAGRLEVAGRIATMETRLTRLAGELSTCVVARRSPPASPTRSRPPLIDASPGSLNKNTPHHVNTFGADANAPAPVLTSSPLRVDRLHVHGQEQHRDMHLAQTYSSPRSSAGGSVRVALFEADPAAAWTARDEAYTNDRGRGGAGVVDAGGSGDSGLGSRAHKLHARLRDDIEDVRTSEDRRRRGGARGGGNTQVTSATTAPHWTSLPRSPPQYAFPGGGDTYEYHHHHHHGQGHSVSPPLSPRSPRSPQRYVSVPLPSPLVNDRIRHTRTAAPEDVQVRWESEPPAAADDPRCGEEDGEGGGM